VRPGALIVMERWGTCARAAWIPRARSIPDRLRKARLDRDRLPRERDTPPVPFNSRQLHSIPAGEIDPSFPRIPTEGRPLTTVRPSASGIAAPISSSKGDGIS
jgi:hypothetical protein